MVSQKMAPKKYGSKNVENRVFQILFYIFDAPALQPKLS
jgi:hypothetical protein